MPSETSVSTPLPEGLAPAAVIAALHDHERYIRTTCPQLVGYKHVTGRPSLAEPCEYEVTDKKPIGQTTYRLTLTNQGEGVDAVVEGKAPTGGALTIRSRWRVRAARLEEAVEIDCNLLMNKMIKGNVEKSHPGLHRGFLAAEAEAR
ncbi:hypothetical protein F4780DRAFT_775838 [Xylariomycetidae sp. FL0641]|nr:hypothetical protein F4780DRAFT_775838 [Xylariomycetidae sp. FL0641]